MTIRKQKAPTRAIVLGGGGITGIAWEIGVLTGLLEAGRLSMRPTRSLVLLLEPSSALL